MVYQPQQQLAHRLNLVSHLRRITRKALAPALISLASLGLLLSFPGAAGAGTADHLMCGWKTDYRTQTVSIDPDLARAGVTYDDVMAAFRPWNDLFVKYHGFPIFTVHYGNWWQADILLTAHGTAGTWVYGRCSLGYLQNGNNHTIVFLGWQDTWRNRTMLPHELGHALGFADHGSADASSGHIGYRQCADYIGVMSYCTSPQSWFLDLHLAGYLVDGQLVRDYWQP